MTNPNPNPKGAWGWLVASLGAIIALGTILIYGDRAGAVFGYYWPPEIVSFAPDPDSQGDDRPHLVVVKNPSIEEVVITGLRYEITPIWGDMVFTGTAAATASDDRPARVMEPVTLKGGVAPPCVAGVFHKALAQPVSIDPKRTGPLRVNLRPRNVLDATGCIVRLALASDHGDTDFEEAQFSFEKAPRK